MVKRTFTIDETLERSAKKLNHFADKLARNAHGEVRDAQGVALTQNRIMKSIENFADAGLMGTNATLLNEAVINGAIATFSKTNKNFSANDNESLMDLDVVDISLGATLASHGLTYFAADRAMSSVNESINFQGLVAENQAAGYSAGDVVYDPRMAISSAINLGRDGAKVTTNATGVAAEESGSGVAEFKIEPATLAPVIKSEVKLYRVLTADLATAKPELVGFVSPMDKPNKAGEVDLVWKLGGVFNSGKINLNTGVFTGTLAGDASAYTFILECCVDRGAQKDGANTLRLKPVMQNYILESKENMVFLDISIDTQAVMNRILRENSKFGLDVDYGKRAISQLIEIYTYFIDTNIFRELHAGLINEPVINTLDISTYTGDFKTFSTTKNDRILTFINMLTSALLYRTNKPCTAIAVDDVAARVLSTDTDNMVLDPAFRSRRDGFIGSYAGIPVIRSAYLTGKSSNTTNGLVIAVHKSLDGMAAPVFFGEYLAPFSSLPSLNYNNPSQLSQALMSHNGAKCIVPQFAVKGEITVGAAYQYAVQP